MQRFTTHDGLSLSFRDEGEGLPVLCLSGLTRNASDFDYIAPHLADTRLIRMDYRGRGTSDWADPATYTPAIEAQDALALLDHLGVEQAAILGTSRGGIIAMLLAATAKPRLLGVCLNDIGPEIAPEGLEMIRGYLGRNPIAGSIPELAVARARLMTGFEDVPDSRWIEEAEKHYVDTGDGITINYDPDLARVFDAPDPGDTPAPVDMWPMFEAMQGLPLALIRGVNSNILTLETAEEMHKRRPDMIRAEVPGRGHVPFLDEADSVQAIRDWLEVMQ